MMKIIINKLFIKKRLQNYQYSQKIIERAERCDYNALVITVDHCEIGNKECDIHSEFSLSNDIHAENMIDDDNNDFDKIFRRSPINVALSNYCFE